MKVVLALALLAGGAATAEESRDPTPAWAMDTRSERMVLAGGLTAAAVVAPDGTPLGDVEGTILTRDGRIAGLIVGVGGWFGLGEHPVAIRWERLRFEDAPDGDGVRVVTDVPRAALAAAPAYAPRR
jgi:hypothetical protein